MSGSGPHTRVGHPDPALCDPDLVLLSRHTRANPLYDPRYNSRGASAAQQGFSEQNRRHRPHGHKSQNEERVFDEALAHGRA